MRVISIVLLLDYSPSYWRYIYIYRRRMHYLPPPSSGQTAAPDHRHITAQPTSLSVWRGQNRTQPECNMAQCLGLDALTHRPTRSRALWQTQRIWGNCKKMNYGKTV